MEIQANNPLLKSWVQVENNSDFPIQNIPFGIFKTSTLSPRIGVAIGNQVLDLAQLNKLGYFKNIEQSIFENNYLNDFIALGKSSCREIRDRISYLLNIENKELQNNKQHQQQVLISAEKVEMLMPIKIGDYTDFYSSIDHATNVGTMFRDPSNALLPNWKHLPVGYHGRSSTIVPSGIPVHRPNGQTLTNGETNPVFGPSKLVDFELETAFITTDANIMGEPIAVDEAEEHIFGMVLFNDWSARDIQKWEYVPLGPFLAKNFASSISPWIVTMDALEPFRVKGPEQSPEPLPYLQQKGAKAFDINLEVSIKPENSTETVVSRSNFKYMYWSMAQQLAHHTINGCRINSGDMMGSGTISGPTEDSYGSMLELTWGGKNPIKLNDGSERKFINDNDTVIIRGFCQKENLRIGFGEVSSKLLPAIDLKFEK